MIRPAEQGSDPTSPATPGLASFRLLTPAEVVQALRFKTGRPDQTLRTLQRQGLRLLVISGRLRVRPQDLTAFQEKLAEAEDAATEGRR